MQIAILSFFHYFTLMFKKRESVFEVEEGKFLSPKFDAEGLISVTTTDSSTGELLMHGYMNKSVKKDYRTKKLTIGVDQEKLYGKKVKLVGLCRK